MPILTTGVGIFPVTSTTPPVPSFLTHGQSNSSTASQSLTGVSTGTATSDRLLIITVDSNNVLYTMTSVTVTPDVGSPVTATLVEEKVNINAGYGSIWQAIVTTGTSASIDIVYSNNPFASSRIGVWSIASNNMTSTTAVDHKSTTTASGSSLSITTLSSSLNGFIIATGSVTDTGGGTTLVISGTDSYTSRFGANGVLGAGQRDQGADASGVSSHSGDNTVTITSSVTAAMLLVAASWR